MKKDSSPQSAWPVVFAAVVLIVMIDNWFRYVLMAGMVVVVLKELVYAFVALKLAREPAPEEPPAVEEPLTPAGQT